MRPFLAFSWSANGQQLYDELEGGIGRYFQNALLAVAQLWRNYHRPLQPATLTSAPVLILIAASAQDHHAIVIKPDTLVQ